MKKKFCEKLVESRPDMIGKSVWFFLNKCHSLECVINENGTVSVASSPTSRFSTAKDLIAAIKKEEISTPADFRLPLAGTLSKLSFNNHLFLSPERSSHIGYFMAHPEVPLPLLSPNISDRRRCSGFVVEDRLVALMSHRSIKVTFLNQLIQKR